MGSGFAGDRLIFDDANALACKEISPYILPGPLPIVMGRRRPLSNIPSMDMGNMPLDGGGLILDDPSEIERYSSQFRMDHVKKLLGSTEIIEGTARYCLWFDDEPTDQERAEPGIAARLAAVETMRSKSSDAGTRAHAAEPWRFRDTKRARETLIALSKTSSENRQVLPADWFQSDTIITDLGFVIYDAPLWALSLITSRIHLLWIETVCGKLETRYRYSNTLGWHTFPVPPLSGRDCERLTACAENILITRAEVGGSLGDLYDAARTPDALREAHRLNDEAVEAMYTNRPFRSDSDRLSHLFRRYTRLLAVENGERITPDLDVDVEEAAA